MTGVDEALDEVRARALAGMPFHVNLDPPSRLTRAVAVATAVGAPAVPALTAVQDSLADLAEQRRAVRVAAAQARAVAVGLLGLPMVMVPLLSRLLDLDLMAFYRTAPGMVVGAVAATLLVAGAATVVWLVRRVGRQATPGVGRPSARNVGRQDAPGRGRSGVLLGLVVAGMLVDPLVAAVFATAFVVHVRRSRRPAAPPPDSDELTDLIATALMGGTTAGQALRTVAGALPAHAEALHRMALTLELGSTPGALAPPFDRIHSALARAAAWGAPTAPALRRLASDLRADEHTRVLEAAERLPALLAFPTALCLLPGSILLIGAPLVSAGLATAGT